MAKDKFEMKDLTGLIKEIPVQNLIITSLEFFNTHIGVQTDKFEIEKYGKVSQKPAGLFLRHGEQTSTIVDDQRESVTASMAFTASMASIYPQDFQSIRVPGTDHSETLEGVTSRRIIQLREQVALTHEQMMQAALFRNEIPQPAGKALDIEALTGERQTVAEIDLAGDLIKQIEAIKRLSKHAQGAMSLQCTGYTLFCPPALFDAIRYDESLRNQLLYGNSGLILGKDALFPADILPQVESFRLAGMGLRFIRMEADFTDAYLVPQFRPYSLGDLGCYTHFYGKCARNLELAKGAPREVFLYMQEDLRKREVFVESTFAFVNLKPSVVVKVAIKEPVVSAPEVSGPTGP